MTGKVHAAKNSPALWQSHLLAPGEKDHKYKRGHCLIAGGPMTKTGAARLAARGALRVGAGLVTIASPKDALATYAAHLTAIMIEPADNADELLDLICQDRYSIAVAGPALGTDQNAKEKVSALLASGKPVLLDADAISIWKDDTATLFTSIVKHKRPVVLTPHLGEFGRVFDAPPTDNREHAVLAAARESGAIVVLKGAETLIADPQGNLVCNHHASPYLATAGSGDVLSGIIAGLMANGLPAFEAACAGVWMHGDAAIRFGSGLIAEDLPEMLPEVLSNLD